MGGFTVNGFGATDRFVPIRNLGTFQCPHCKQERMLQLMEVQRKVSLLYIQTVTINTKYAIACASCQNGYYIEEQQKDDILYGRAIATITEQGAVLLKKEKIIDAPEKQEKPSLPQNSQAERPRRDRGRGSGRRSGLGRLAPLPGLLLFQHPVGSRTQVFVLPDQAAGQFVVGKRGVFPLRIALHLDEQDFECRAVEAENDAIYRYRRIER